MDRCTKEAIGFGLEHLHLTCGEYIRLYTHYAFREAVKWAMEKEGLGQPQNWQPQYLIDSDTWMKDYFNENDKSGRNARRKYFAGPTSL